MKLRTDFVKKVILLAIVLCGVLLLNYNTKAYAAEAISDFSFKCGSKVTWNYDSDTDTVIVSGTGPMYDSFEAGIDKAKDAELFIENYRYCRSNAKKVLVEEGITSVGTWFFDFESLSKVVISDTVESIGEKAFLNCRLLTSVSLGKNIEVIGKSAFLYCIELTVIILPENLKRIEFGAFEGCYKLRSVVFNEKLEYIGASAFVDTALSAVIKLPVSVSYLGGCAFLIPAAVLVSNSNCIIKDYAIHGDVHGHKGSTAEKYATEYRKNFIVLDSHEHTYKSKTSKKATLSNNGLITKTCTICAKSVEKSIYKIESVKLSSTKCVYTGKTKTPTVTVKDSKGNKLKKDTDYTVTYSSGRKNVGIYNVKVTFKGKYTGVKTLSFKIIPDKVTGLKQDKSKPGLYVSWNKVAGVTGYEVYEYNNGKYTKIGSFKLNFVYNKSVVVSVKWKVRAYYKDSDGKVYYGDFSDVKTFKGVSL